MNQNICHMVNVMHENNSAYRACIINRDGKLFKYLLDYLHGDVVFPDDEQSRLALQDEADYFGIPYPYNLTDHLANEMESYCLRSNVELRKALSDLCDSYGLCCSTPKVWILHYLNTSGASCESKIIGVYGTKDDGIQAIEKQLGGRIHSKSMFMREAGNNLQYIWSYYSAADLKRMMDAFDVWQGRGISYWRVPQEVIECWTLEGWSLHGSLPPVQKRRLISLNEEEEEEEEETKSKSGLKRIKYSGPSTSTCIKVKNSQKVIKPGVTVNASKTTPSTVIRLSTRPLKKTDTGISVNHSSSETLSAVSDSVSSGPSEPLKCQRTENTIETSKPTIRVYIPERKNTTSRVIKLKRPQLSSVSSLPIKSSPPSSPPSSSVDSAHPETASCQMPSTSAGQSTLHEKTQDLAAAPSMEEVDNLELKTADNG